MPLKRKRTLESEREVVETEEELKPFNLLAMSKDYSFKSGYMPSTNNRVSANSPG